MREGGSECSRISCPTRPGNSDASDKALKIRKIRGGGFVSFYIRGA